MATNTAEPQATKPECKGQFAKGVITFLPDDPGETALIIDAYDITVTSDGERVSIVCTWNQEGREKLCPPE